MQRALIRTTLLALLAPMLATNLARGEGRERPWFPDRPVARSEHDDAHVATAPAPSHLQDLSTTLLLRDSLANEIDRVLALESGHPAEDVNAADEVPCSTWFCPRNHLVPLSVDVVAAGVAADPPRLPLRIVKGKDQGAASGFQVVDAGGRKFMLKFDPAGHLGLATAGEMIGARIFHAAGYNVPGTFLLDLAGADLVLDPRATFRLRDVELRPLTGERVRQQLDAVARGPDGRIRAVAVSWLPGEVLGGFDLIGRRDDDPNDRIPHQHRRSLRANWILHAWLSVLDPSSINTIDSYVEEAGRRFVRHYHFDFGCSFGSSTTHLQGLHSNAEYPIEVGRTLAAFVSLGAYRRPFQDQRAEWERLTRVYPSVGHFQTDTFDPDSFRTNLKLATHVRMTTRDGYWGAKVVSSFSDAQIAAIVATARLPARDADYVLRALRARRDILARRYLGALAAVEKPLVAADGGKVCFEDLALARGYASARDVRYEVRISDGLGRHLTAGQRPADGVSSCVVIPRADPETGYRIVQVVARSGADGGTSAISKASRIHLRWRESERRFVVVGLERDE